MNVSMSIHTLQPIVTGEVMKKTSALVIVMLALMTAGCSVFVRPPAETAKGGKVVVILYKHSGFKDAVVASVKSSLEGKGYTIVTESTKRAKFFKAAEYGAVVYMADYWMRHVPRHAVRYNKQNGEAPNILFVVTSGDPDIKIKKPFDAVTSASKSDRVEPVAKEMLGRLATVLK